MYNKDVNLKFSKFLWTPDPEMIDEWMDVMHKKQELKEKESKLMLQ